jgi:hypothetical protein
MDQYGIGTAIQGMVRIYTETARRTGRTTHMLDNLKDGDRVVCLTSTPEAKRLERLARERGLKVQFITLDPRQPEKLFESGTPEGRTIFDHSWVEEYFRRGIDRLAEDIDRLQRDTSGYGEAHRDTRRRAHDEAARRAFRIPGQPFPDPMLKYLFSPPSGGKDVT